MKVNPEIAHQMQTTLEYPDKLGQQCTAKFIMLYAPTTRNVRKVATVKQLLMRSITEQTEKYSPEQIDDFKLQQSAIPQSDKKEKESQESTDEEVSMMMAMVSASNNVDYGDFIQAMINVLKSPDMARIDGDTALTESFIDKIPVGELEVIAGKYLVNFISPSV